MRLRKRRIDRHTTTTTDIRRINVAAVVCLHIKMHRVLMCDFFCCYRKSAYEQSGQHDLSAAKSKRGQWKRRWRIQYAKSTNASEQRLEQSKSKQFGHAESAKFGHQFTGTKSAESRPKYEQCTW